MYLLDEVYCTHTVDFFILFWPNASVSPRSRRWQEWHCWQCTSREKKLPPTQQLQHHRAFPLHSSNDDRLFTCPQHQTHVAFSKTNNMVSSLCRGTSAHSYSGFSVLSTQHLYGKCCMPLFCSVGGFCPFVWKRHQTGPEGHMMAWTWSRWLFFVLLHCH